MQPDVIPILLRVPRRDIAYVKFVVESYEGVAVTRTVDPAAGLVVVLVAPDFLPVAERVLSALAAEGACETMEAPAGSDVDWLGPEPRDPEPHNSEEAP
jgi:Domain of unknown function (DUF4911)